MDVVEVYFDDHSKSIVADYSTNRVIVKP